MAVMSNSTWGYYYQICDAVTPVIWIPSLSLSLDNTITDDINEQEKPSQICSRINVFLLIMLLLYWNYCVYSGILTVSISVIRSHQTKKDTQCNIQRQKKKRINNAPRNTEN